ncbi:MAG: endolytic transglycosylase MltG [Patescibacteria group bacterium]|nr:endolytic transglycosylase MltG [Patescibacteria group bacterium]
MRKITVLISYLMIISLVVFLYLDYQASKPMGQNEETTIFIITKGESLKKIGENLEKEGLIKDRNIFVLYSFLRNLRKKFLPGKYELKKSLSLKEIVEILTSSLSREKKITIIEGWSVKEIAENLEQEGLVKKEDFLTKVQEVNQFREKYDFLRDDKIKSLEGFLFPDTYRFYLETESEKIISKMLDNFDQKMTDELKEEIKKQGKTIFEIVTLASIIEKEVPLRKDKKIVADIFLRRLKNNLPLQADSTINYLTGKKVRRASLEDLKIDNPYNTYKYKGLPPGPISNPGLDSILAVIYPEKNDWWYFLSKEDGTTIYSRTFEEHRANKIKYLEDQESYKRGELLVKYKNEEKISKIFFNPQEDIEEIKAKILNQNKNIEMIEPNYLFRASYLTNDPFYFEQWYLEKIQAPKAWDLVKGGREDITIAVLDSGVDIDHPDLKDNIWVNQKEIAGDRLDNDNNGYVDDLNGWDFVDNLPNPKPKFLPTYTTAGIHHGTVVAGVSVAVGDNHQGVSGLAWKVKIMPLRVLNNAGEGSLDDVIKAVNYAIVNKADVINLSFVGPNRSQLLLETLKEAWRQGLVIVAAAGNDALNQGQDLDTSPLYPICLDQGERENFILGVTATNEIDKKASFANFGSRCVDLTAPGTRIYSTLFYAPEKEDYRNYYGGYWSGTSLATPLVSATAALIKSLNPSVLTNQEIRDLILETVEKIDYLNPGLTGKLGQGRLNVYQAVNEAYQRLTQKSSDRYIITASGKGSSPLVKIFTPTGVLTGEFYAYQKDFKGGVSLTSGDVDGDGLEEIITGPGQGGGPHLKIFNQKGNLKGHFFAYDKNFKNGISVAAGDLDGYSQDEIVVAPQKGTAKLKVFDKDGNLLSAFFPYQPNFNGGVSVAVGDLNGDGRKEIITGPGQGGGPQVRIFDLKGRIIGQFFAFHEKFKGGINVEAGDLDGDGLDEIVVSIASRASPYLRIFDRFGYLKGQFLAYQPDFYQGVTLSVSVIDQTKKARIVTAPFRGGGPQVRIFDLEGNVLGQFFAYPKTMGSGLSVATIKKIND